MNVAGLTLADPRPTGGGDICRAFRARLPDGTTVFAKTLSGAPPGFFAAEARGLDLLRGSGRPGVPAVVAVGDDGLVLEWLDSTGPTADAAAGFGAALAAMHRTTSTAFGAGERGYIGSLPLDNRPVADWPAFYVERRLLPFLDALDAPARTAVETVCARIDELAGPAEPPALVHGDLWSGNVVWSTGGTAYLVDAAAAHFGHRETDLAMLDLFGAPFLDRVLDAYQDVWPLADGWRERVGLHQLHPLLVHARLFGGGYVARAGAVARAASGT